MFDVIIIGCGITGASIAYELSKYELKVGILEALNDVGDATSKANSGIVHAGFDAKPGSKKAFFNVNGAKMYPNLCEELDFPYKKNGAFVLSFSNDGHDTLNELLKRAKENNVSGCSIISGDEIRKMGLMFQNRLWKDYMLRILE